MGSKTTHFCDVCKKEGEIQNKKLPVIFTTEQTEGRGIKPYLTESAMDICKPCFEHITEDDGHLLWGHGAMGYNTYYFKDRK